MKTATFHHQLAPWQDSNVSEIDRNLDFATMENIHHGEACLRHGRIQLRSLSFAGQPTRIPQLEHWLVCLVG